MAVWYDEAQTVAAVLAILRLEEGDVDEGRLTALVPRAAKRLEVYADRVDPFPGPPPTRSFRRRWSRRW